jgi:hypothetical protein
MSCSRKDASSAASMIRARMISALPTVLPAPPGDLGELVERVGGVEVEQGGVLDLHAPARCSTTKVDDSGTHM